MARTPIKTPADTIYVLNGPNLDSMGACERVTRGHADLAELDELCASTAAKFGLQAECMHSSGEDELIGFIHQVQANNNAAGIVINAGTCSRRSNALQDALAAAKIPAIEVQSGDLHARESFRHHSFTARAALATLAGFGVDGYRLAINGLAASIGVTAKA
jgi:3-dehydroquinate dehydratase-2